MRKFIVLQNQLLPVKKNTHYTIRIKRRQFSKVGDIYNIKFRIIRLLPISKTALLLFLFHNNNILILGEIANNRFNAITFIIRKYRNTFASRLRANVTSYFCFAFSVRPPPFYG